MSWSREPALQLSATGVLAPDAENQQNILHTLVTALQFISEIYLFNLGLQHVTISDDDDAYHFHTKDSFPQDAPHANIIITPDVLPYAWYCIAVPRVAARHAFGVNDELYNFVTDTRVIGSVSSSVNASCRLFP